MFDIVAVARPLVPQPVRTALKARLHMRRHKGAAVFVHVGKCGGTTLIDALRGSARFKDFFYVHMVRPPVSARWRYVIALRNPISRFISAFNHHRRSFEIGGRECGDPAEIQAIFSSYRDANELANALYIDEQPNTALMRSISKIGHLHRGPAYYLDRLFASSAASRIEVVFTQETLANDIAIELGRTDAPRHRFVSGEGWRKSVDATGARNLERFLAPDFVCVRRLVALGKIDSEKAIFLLDAPGGNEPGVPG